MPGVTVAAIVLGLDDVRRVALAALASLCRPVVVSVDLPGLPVERASGNSARLGLATALATTPDLDAALFLRSDQTWVTAGSIRRLLDKFQRTHLPIAVMCQDHNAGPALFSRTLLSDIIAGKELPAIIAEHQFQVARIVEQEKAHPLLDEQRVGR
jgi:CTP:molybdopterin cytidylyltransferase MocA